MKVSFTIIFPRSGLFSRKMILIIVTDTIGTEKNWKIGKTFSKMEKLSVDWFEP